MSRSIHETRRDEERERRRCRHDREASLENLERLQQRLEAKRDLKRRTREERSGLPPSPFPPIDPDTIPIEVGDKKSDTHYPASPDDIRDVLRRLVPDALNGLKAIRLTLGLKRQREWVHAGAPGQLPSGSDPAPPDPLSGRPGVDLLPGLYSPPVLGSYSRAGVISLYAYVYLPDRSNRHLIETFLRLKMLSTLVHEVGHHEDHAFRSVKGRWRMADRNKVEQYAEERQHRWLLDAVLPSVEERHPEEIRQLLTWVEEHGGARMSIADLAGDPRSQNAAGYANISALFTIEDALWALFQDVEEGVDPIATRVAFAEEIHYSERYETALGILDRVLMERPEDVEALVLRGDVLEHLDQYEPARAALERALELAPGHKRAIANLVSVHYWTFSWQKLVEVAKDYLTRETQEDFEDHRIRARYGRALIELGRFDEAETAIPAPAGDGIFARQFAGLRALAAYRRGEPERALAIAEEHPQDPDSAFGLLLRAVHRLALMCAGRTEEAGQLSKRDRDRLVREGLGYLDATAPPIEPATGE